MTEFLKLKPGRVGGQPVSLSNDPYFYWAEASGFIDYVPRNREVPKCFLTAFQASGDNSFKAFLACVNPDSVLSNWVNDKGSVFGVALLSTSTLEKLSALPEVAQGDVRFETSLLLRDPRPRRDPSQPDMSAQLPAVSEKSTSTVLLGLVDYGCPFAHTGLRNKDDTTRILSLWDQNNREHAGSTLGKAFSRSDLSKFMTDTKTPGGSVDEAACYQKYGFDSLASRNSHGAHMLGLLAGAAASPSLLDGQDLTTLLSKPWKDTATTSDIVFVQLPSEYLQSMPRTGLAPYQLLAMKYILDSAGDHTSWIVIPVSSETFEGPHDGSSLMESAIDALVEYADSAKGKTLDIVFASGNAADLAISQKLPEAKANDRSPSIYETCFTVRVLPNNELPTFVEIWFPSKTADMEISITPPDQPASAPVAGGSWVWPDVDAPECTILHPQAVQACGRGKLICIRIAPTFSVKNEGALASFGDWRITLSARSTISDGWAYIARSFHGVGGMRRSYQSYFPEHQLRKDWELLNGDPAAKTGLGSVNGIACGSKVTVVSGYVLHPRKQTGDGIRAEYAGRGPTRGGRLQKSSLVDGAAPIEQSLCLRGIKSWGNSSGASIRMNGTSVAAPLAARELAQFGVMCGSTTSDPNCESQLEPNGRLGGN